MFLYLDELIWFGLKIYRRRVFNFNSVLIEVMWEGEKGFHQNLVQEGEKHINHNVEDRYCVDYRVGIHMAY